MSPVFTAPKGYSAPGVAGDTIQCIGKRYLVKPGQVTSSPQRELVQPPRPRVRHGASVPTWPHRLVTAGSSLCSCLCRLPSQHGS